MRRLNISCSVIMEIVENKKYKVSMSKNDEDRLILAKLAYNEGLFVDRDDYLIKEVLGDIINGESPIRMNSLRGARLILVEKKNLNSEMKAVGVCLFMPRNVATVNFFVKPEERNKGVGKILVRGLKYSVNCGDLFTFSNGCDNSNYFFEKMIKCGLLNVKNYIFENNYDDVKNRVFKRVVFNEKFEQRKKDRLENEFKKEKNSKGARLYMA